MSNNKYKLEIDKVEVEPVFDGGPYLKWASLSLSMRMVTMKGFKGD